jgi:hypothetical protein
MKRQEIIKIDNDLCKINIESLNKNDGEKLKNHIQKYLIIDNINNVLHSINKDALYKIEYWPSGKVLPKNSNGTFAGVFRSEDGKISEHVQLREAGIDFIKLTKTFVNQIMTMYIVSQLSDIKVKCEKILKGQRNDRIGDITGAIKFNEIFPGKDIYGTIRQIITGIDKLERDLEQELDELKTEKEFSDNWISNKTDENVKNYKSICEILFNIFFGYRNLIELEFDLESTNQQHFSANRSIELFRKFLYTCKWCKIEDLELASLPYEKDNDGHYPGEIWRRINSNKDDIIKEMENRIEERRSLYNINKYELTAKGNTFKEVLK